jgi:ABC-type branched-subunit amino acid transport system ATPase component
LCIDGVEVRYGGVVALADMSITFRRGEITSIVGPNGAGKSTLLGAATGHRSLAAGGIMLDDRVMPAKRRAAMHFARAGIRRTFQTSRLVADMTVVDNVRIGGYQTHRSRLLDDLLDTPRRRRSERDSYEEALSALRVVGLEDVARTNAGAISYGQVRLVEVARALMGRPQYLLLDEPAAGLNDVETDALGSLLTKLVTSGMGVVLVEHNLGLVMSISSAIHVLNFGRLIASGPPDVVADDPAVIEAYTGVVRA